MTFPQKVTRPKKNFFLQFSVLLHKNEYRGTHVLDLMHVTAVSITPAVLCEAESDFRIKNSVSDNS
jgi:hypothetical protein